MKALPFLLCSGLALGGCSMLGPDFVAPDRGAEERWERPAEPGVYSRPTLQPLDPQWWKLFDDPLLSSLQERAMAGNLDLRTASARLRQSRAIFQTLSGEALPEVGANAFVQRQRNSNSGRVDQSGREGKEAYNHGYASLDATWEMDFWGRVGRQIESAEASVEASEELRRGVLVLILADTASHYIRLRGEQAFEAVIRDNLEIARRNLELTGIRFDNGVATRLEVAQAEAEVATVEARLPATRERQARLINALSFLLGAGPNALRAELQASRDIPVPPKAVPLGLPSELALRRPDIRAAEARLHAATASIGVAQADFYPRITLNGGFGFESSQFLPFEWQNRLFLLGSSLYLPIFEGGRLKGRLALREAEQQEAAVAYRRTVLKAWHEVDDALTDYGTRQQRRVKLNEAVRQNEEVLGNARQQYLAGAVDFLNVLGAQRELLSVEEQRVRSDEAVALGIVDLYRALGGGWEGQEERASR
ncbi:efflux transporter outer membrane subunit [Azotobacter vinelandii]